MAAITEREQEELAARHAIMRDTVAAQAEQLAQAQARIRELEGERATMLTHLAASDMRSFCTPEERAVLDATAKLHQGALNAMSNIAFFPDLISVVHAELARRAAKGGG